VIDDSNREAIAIEIDIYYSEKIIRVFERLELPRMPEVLR
jgi:hypothetical protein